MLVKALFAWFHTGKGEVNLVKKMWVKNIYMDIYIWTVRDYNTLEHASLWLAQFTWVCKQCYLKSTIM